MRWVGGALQLAATDLSDHVHCPHLSTLSLAHVRGELAGFTNYDPLLDVLAERGRDHEAAYVEHLRAVGFRVESAQALPSPLPLMQAGVEIITQAVLAADGWQGRADFLERVERPSSLGAWSYEVVDTKLASDTRAGAILQLCVYSDLLAALQGATPAAMHVVKPGDAFPRESYRYDEYAAIYRALRRELEDHVARDVRTYPEPTAHCGSCRWRTRCDGERRRDDHLALVADLGRRHQRELARHAIRTTTALAAVATPWPHPIAHGARATYERLAHQARLQVTARGRARAPYELLPVEPDRGVARLPAPSAGDVYLDLEGDPFIGANGREFLFGWYTHDRGYERIWALDDIGEHAALERFLDITLGRWAVDRGMHVYHFAPYEPTALQRLVGRYGRRAEDLGELLRGRRFVDLHAIAKQAARIGVESYGLKSLEPVIGFSRATGLDITGPSMRAVLALLRRDAAAAIDVAVRGLGPPGSIEVRWLRHVEAYNRGDCEAAAALHRWLEARRAELVAEGRAIERPPLLDGERESITEVRTLAAATAIRLLHDLPITAEARTPDEQARWLLGHLLEWYRREQSVVWWEFFRLARTTHDERLDELAAISGLRFVERLPGKRLPIDRYAFPPQEVFASPGDDLAIDETTKLGELVRLDIASCTVDIRKTAKTVDLHPPSVFAQRIIAPKPKDLALVRAGLAVAGAGFPAAAEPSLVRDLLVRAPPRGLAAPLRHPGEAVDACAIRLALALDGTVLPIQGPPGTGKTHTAAAMIVALARAGRRVGVTATSHAVIDNLVRRVVDLAPLRVLVKGEPIGDPHSGIEYTSSATDAEARVGDVDVLGATAWQWAREGMASSVDTLVIDEAGQMSLADAVAVAGAAHNLVLVGDPQQLEQPIQGTHPEGVAVSVLQHVLGEAQTIPADRGLFLDATHRLHPAVCAFVSEQFYERRLVPGPRVAAQAFHAPPLASCGLYWHPVVHHGNQNHSDEEAAAVAALAAACLAGGTWTDEHGRTRPLEARDLLVVAPYNAHVAAIRAALAERGLAIAVGTVDKFQGREAAISIYAMATSLPEDAPRGLGFLYDRHRLDVATSRARGASVIVASPALLRPACSTPQHLHLASALARFVELATRI